MVFKNYKLHLKNAKRQAVVTKKYFTLEKMQEQLNVYIDKYVPNFPEELDLVIPGPKTIELPKRPKK